MTIPQNLFILPFDHQTGLFKEFGWIEPITEEQRELMMTTRELTYQGYLHGLTLGIPKEMTAILTDDIYGSEVIKEAHLNKTPVIYTLEKSGQPHLIFQHEDWENQIKSQNPDWIKTLVRYNPEANKNDLNITIENLKKVSGYSKAHNIPFMIEPLVQPTESQKEIADFDHTTRPDLTVRMMDEIYSNGIYPAVWKIEGSDDVEFYNKASAVIAKYDPNARIVVLGRNETIENVSKWFAAGAQNDYVIGFAVGRTVFLDAIKKYMSGEFTNTDAIKEIGENYFKLYQAFVNAKTHV